jgi:hypothetical protein
MDDKSPTDNGNDQSSSDSRNDESLLDNGQQNQSADEQSQGTDSGEQSQDSSTSQDDERQNDSTRDGSSTDDDGLAKFAKAQGIEDLDELSERELRLLKVARDNQKSARKGNGNKQELDKAVSDAFDPSQVVDEDADDDVNEARIARMETAQVKAELKLDRFYRENPDAEEYEAEMAEALQNEIKQYGAQAGQVLAQNLPRLLREAKAIRGDGHDADAAREAGRREEREALRRKQEGAADTASASTPTRGGTSKVTRKWIAETYDPSNEDHRKMLDEAMAKGAIPD